MEARTVVPIAAIVCAFGAARAQTFVPGERPPSPEEVTQAKSRRDAGRLQARIIREEYAITKREKRIDQEVAALDRARLKDSDWAKEWAGSYCAGGGLTTSVVIKVAPKAGLTYACYGCMGLQDANYADVVEPFDGGLKAKLVLDERVSQWRYMSGTLYFVRWGERRYLIPESQMMTFVNNYNEGGFGRSSMFGIPLQVQPGEGLRTATPVPTGKPELPPKYAALLLDQPMALAVSKVTEVGSREVTENLRIIELRLELEGGADQGVYFGMRVPYEVGPTFGLLEIDRVEQHSCSGRLRLSCLKDKELAKPEVGTLLRFPEPLLVHPK